jgi:hypothetical protein
VHIFKNPLRNTGIVTAVWLAALFIPVIWAIVYHLDRAGTNDAAILKATFGYISLFAGVVGLLILVRYKNLVVMTPTKAGFRDKLGFVLAAVGVVTAVLGLFN